MRVRLVVCNGPGRLNCNNGGGEGGKNREVALGSGKDKCLMSRD